jgi:hypothetical protein
MNCGPEAEFIVKKVDDGVSLLEGRHYYEGGASRFASIIAKKLYPQ